ncbi:MAG: GNAT family N-acetyltransferase [Pseudomonadota bacterium]
MTDIQHDIAARRYSLTIEGIEAHLDYDRRADGAIHITHTNVPRMLGGRGLGKQLVTRAVEDSLAKGLPVASSCWFATELIEAHPDWKAALV